MTVTVVGVNSPPAADSGQITVPVGSSGGKLGLDAPVDPEGDPLSIRVSKLPKVGTLRLANGKPVQVGQFLSAGQLETLVYDAPATYRGKKPVFFRYLVSDGQYSTEATVEIRLVRSVRCQTADFGKGKGLKSMPASLAQESSQNGQKGKGAGKLRK